MTKFKKFLVSVAAVAVLGTGMAVVAEVSDPAAVEANTGTSSWKTYTTIDHGPWNCKVSQRHTVGSGGRPKVETRFKGSYCIGLRIDIRHSVKYKWVSGNCCYWYNFSVTSGTYISSNNFVVGATMAHYGTLSIGARLRIHDDSHNGGEHGCHPSCGGYYYVN